MEVLGKPDAISTVRSGGKPLILKYHDIELHFDGKAHCGLYLIYSDDEIELSITDEHKERNKKPLTRIINCWTRCTRTNTILISWWTR